MNKKINFTYSSYLILKNCHLLIFNITMVLNLTITFFLISLVKQ